MKICEQLENDSNPVVWLLINLFAVLLFAFGEVWMAGDWLEFIKAVTNHEELIHITAGMGIFPAGLILALLFTLATFPFVLMLIAKYTHHPGLLDYDPSKSWLALCFRLCIYGLIIFGSFYFILPVFSDTIAKKMGYEYYCPQKARIPGQSPRFYRYTYAGSPLLCPDTEDEK